MAGERGAERDAVEAVVAGRSGGDLPFIAIPVFPSRAFRHSAIYVHTGSGVHRPEALRGKRVGVAEYQLSANAWIRGILEDEHWIHPSEILWDSGGSSSRVGARRDHRFSCRPLIADELFAKETLDTFKTRSDEDRWGYNCSSARRTVAAD